MTLRPSAKANVETWGALINGEFRPAVNGKTFPTFNPGNGEIIAYLAECDEEDIDLAVRAALAAYPAWKKKTGAARAKLLMKLAQLVEANGPKLAELESLNAGKPIRDSKAIDAVTAIDALEYFAGMATKIQGDTIPVPGPYINMTLREPLGVIGGIIPWNYPLLQAVWKIAPAIAAGNTVVVKPAEQACLSVMFFGKLCTEAGIPPGVVNIVPGYGAVAGAALVDHHMVAKVMFTGSTMTGKRIAAQAANTLKPIGLELGGKSAVIVFEDAPIDQAAQVAAMSIFSNMGQVCTAGSRLFLHEKVHDKVLEKVIENAKKIKLGDQMDPSTTMGPLISAKQKERVTGYIDSGKTDAKLVHSTDVPKGLEQRPLCRADHLRRRAKLDEDRARGDLRARCSRCSPSRKKAKRWRWRTIAPMGSPHPSSLATLAVQCGRRRPSRRATSGSTPGARCRRWRLMAATRTPATAARWVSRLCGS